MKNKKGFTLIELLIVIVILGILVAVAIPSFTNILYKSKIDTYTVNVNRALSTIELDKLNNESKKYYSLNDINNLLDKKLTKSPFNNDYSLSSEISINSDGTYNVCIDDGSHIVYKDNVKLIDTIDVLKIDNENVYDCNKYLFKYVAIEAGSSHSLAIDNQGQVYAWGSNSSGQLGDGTTIDKSVPTLINSSNFNNEKVVNISAGESHSLAITETGKLYAWGGNYSSQLGDGTTVDKSVPTLINPSNFNNEEVVIMAAGRYYSLAITETGKLYKWGRSQLTPDLIDITNFNNERVVDAATNTADFAAVTESGIVYTWGGYTNGSGGTNLHNPTPTAILKTRFNGEEIISIEDGFTVITNTGKVYTWVGYKEGYPITYHHKAPALVSTGFNNEEMVMVSKEIDHRLALSNKGAVYAWGENSYGELGLGNTTTQTNPQEINQTNFDGEKIVSIAAGRNHSLALTETGKIYAWGGNYSGQLGDGTTTDTSTPILLD